MYSPKALYNRLGSCVYSAYAEYYLAALFYLEALILFLPTDPMLIVYCLERRSRAFRYAAIATCFSVLGGVTGYLCGYLLFHTVGDAIIHNSWVNAIISAEHIMYLCGEYHKHAALAIFIAGFTPIPYKAATFTAGFCGIPLTSFIFFSFLSRGARFYLYAVAITLWGGRIKEYIDRYFNILVLLSMGILGCIVWYVK